MIKATFYRENGKYKSFIVSGHAGYDRYGKDIVCAGVSSAVMLTINTIMTYYDRAAKVKVADNKTGIRLSGKSENMGAEIAILSLYKHLNALREDYGHIEIKHKNIVRKGF